MTDRTDEPIDFAAYARRRDQHQSDLDTAHRAWMDAVAKQGASLSDPTAAAAALGVADLMDRLVTGALLIRLGGLGRVPDPNGGLDEVGAQTMRDLMADLRSAVEAAQESVGE